MQINPISTQEPNFQGSLRIKGNWPNKGVQNTLRENEFIKKVLEKNSITANMKSMHKKEGFSDMTLYKLQISAQKDNPTLWDRMKYMFGIHSKTNLCEHYHSSYTMEKMINSRLEKTLKRLNIDA